MEKLLEYKSVSVSTQNTIKDIDTRLGIVTGYFSVFGNKDSDEDIIMPGAFTKTLQENYRRIKHLYQHDTWRPLSATKNNNLVLTQDNYGLHFVSTISKTSWGKDAIQLYVDGVIDEQSIGFETVKSNDKGDYREITEVKLWEGSAVTFAANDLAITTDVKSLDKDWLFKRMDSVAKAIRNGKYENEDIFDSLEFYLKQLQKLIYNLTQDTKPPVQDTLPDVRDAIKSFTQSLNAK